MNPTEFKLENLPVPDVSVKATPLNDGTIELQTNIMGFVTTEIVRLKEKACREALINLGWTPPTGEDDD